MISELHIIGQGYVGLPLAKAAVEAGFTVTGHDKDPAIVNSLNSGKSQVDDLDDHAIASMIAEGYTATAETSSLANADAIIVCVPTPLGGDGRPDLTAIHNSMGSIARNLKSGVLIVLESTTYPGTTDGLVLDILERQGHRLDKDFFLAFSPERIDPGNKEYNLTNTPKIVGGVSSNSTKAALELYSRIVDSVIEVKSAKEAEAAKLLENTYRHVNIALVNEMAKFFHEMDIDLWDAIRAARTKPFGFEAFYPGPGVGGHCIPIDPNYLSYEVKRSLGYPFRFVELAQEINQSMPRYVVGRIQEMLNRVCKSLSMSNVLLLGVTYKADIADQRESPAIPIANLLAEMGAQVSFHDPKVSTWTVAEGALSCVADLQAAIVRADVVVLLQNHSSYDPDRMALMSKLFLDTRGSTMADNVDRL